MRIDEMNNDQLFQEDCTTEVINQLFSQANSEFQVVMKQ
jgi:hypothetical protein